MIETLDKLPKDIQPTDRVIRLKTYQDQFIFTEARYPALVSAWGTGKTMCLIEKIRLACEENPGNLILVLRKEFVDLRDSTIKDWNENTGIIVNSGRDAVFPNGSTVMFRHAEELKGNNLNNINLGGFAIEQGEEIESDEVFFKLQGRLRRKNVRHFGAIIANTNGHDWIHRLWKAGNDPDYPLFEATSFDNADVLPVKTIEDWKKLKEKKPKIYNRFVMNSWDESDVTDVIIPPDLVRQAVNRILVRHNAKRSIVSVDVARFGDDKTVMYAIENGRYLGKEEYEKKDTMEIVGRSILFARKMGEINNFAIDEIGVGSGVADRLKEIGKNVIFVNSSKRSNFPDQFYNTRSEIYSHGADLFREGLVEVDGDDTDLVEQLSWAKYKAIKSNGLFQVEPKDDIKERYLRSPDNADAFLNGLWAMQFVQPTDEVKEYVSRRREVNGWKGGSFVPVPAH